MGGLKMIFFPIVVPFSVVVIEILIDIYQR